MDHQITELLSRVPTNQSLAGELMPLVYDQLRVLAANYLDNERAGHTLQATALVNDAYLKLVGRDASYESRSHFFAAAAVAMRQILIDHARARKAAKRGGGVTSSLSIEGAAAEPVGVSPDSTRLAAVSGMQLVIGDAISGSQLTTMPLPFSDGHGVCFGPAGRTISVVSASGKVAMFELDGGAIAKERSLRRAALAWIDAAQSASPGQPVQTALAAASNLGPELRAAIAERAPSRDSPEWLWHLIEVRLGENEATWAERAESCLPLGRRAAELQPEVIRYRARLALLLAVAGHFQEAASQVEADTAPSAVLRRVMLPSDYLTLALSSIGKGDRSSAASHQQAALEMLVRWPTPDEQHDLADRSLQLLELRGLPRPARKEADREVGTDASKQPGPR